MQLIALAALIAVTTPIPTKPLSPRETPRHTAVARIALDDPTIVAIYDAANTYDIETATLGAKKATTAAIRDYGTMLVTVHTSARQDGRDLAKRLGVKPTAPAVNPLAADHMAAMAKLKGLSGKAFDRAFLENEIAYHKAVIAAVQSTLMPAIKNADLKALVVKVSPVFLQHQLAAEQLLAKLPN